MSDDIEPVNQYRQRAARLRSLAADCESPAIVERLLGIALRYDDLAKPREAAKRQFAGELEFKAHDQLSELSTIEMSCRCG
jgi:hypothetical protein